MKIQSCDIEGLFEITLESYPDERGWLARVYDESLFKQFSLNTHWVQDSHSHTRFKNTLRGIYVSLPPHSEGKLIRILRGRMQWVIVDLRPKSPTYGKWKTIVLDEEHRNAIYAARGFAHGCLSLTDNCDLLLKSDNLYSMPHSTGIIWNDPDLGIEWMTSSEPLISSSHLSYNSFRSFQARYGSAE